LPIVVEIVDSEEKIHSFLSVLDGMMSSGLVTIERVQVLQYGTTAPTGLTSSLNLRPQTGGGHE
jgi:uncharacterized protein